MRTPRFSVIIPTLNEEKFIGGLLASLSGQTQKDFEVILVDASGNGKTIAMAEHHRPQLPKLTVIKSQKKLLPFQRNLGASQARGDWLIFVDADSILLPYFFERISAFIAKEHPRFFTSWFRPDSEVGGDALITLLTNIALEISLMIHRPVAPGPLAIVSCEAHQAVGGYDERYRFGEDADYGRRLGEEGFKLELLRETLVICSLRRFRREGTLRVLQTYAVASLAVLLTKRAPKFMPGYLMGGTLYTNLTPRRRSLFRKYETIARKLLKELFA